MMPYIRFALLKKTISIADVLADKGLIGQFKRRGNALVGPCPIHGGDNPNAFVVNLNENIFNCFTQCSAGGDLIDFVRRLDGKNYSEAGTYLASITTVLSHHTHVISKPKKHKAFRPFLTRLSLNPAHPFLKNKAITSSTARAFDAGAYEHNGFLAQSIAVRLHDLQGNPMGYAGRRMDQTQINQYGKWKFPRDFPKNNIFFNYHRIKTHLQQALVVVECPWGVMRLSQLNIPAVALLGTNLSNVQQQILTGVGKVILMLDGDNAGRSAIIKIRKMLEPYNKIVQINLAEGLDPDDLDDLSLINHLKKHF
jgi:DNA primase